MPGQLMRVRPATPDDAPEILRLLGLLAAFEREPDALVTTEAILRRDAFGTRRRFEVLLAETAGRPCGLATLFEAYSSWRGAPTLMIHDLFVEEAGRGSGAGRALVAAAASVALQRGCCRLDVNVLAWNTPARGFYEKLGFDPLPDWMPHRLAGDALARLAEGAER
jgi:GNAT superfamily N-acetyltransferase